MILRLVPSWKHPKSLKIYGILNGGQSFSKVKVGADPGQTQWVVDGAHFTYSLYTIRKRHSFIYSFKDIYSAPTLPGPMLVAADRIISTMV